MTKRKLTDWSWFQKGEIAQALTACRNLGKAGILSGIYPDEIERASLTFLLINLNDLLQKLDWMGHRLETKDDIHPSCKAVDVTALINNARNAACHLNSGNHLLDKNKVAYCVVRGRFPNAIWMNGVALGCEYPDDTAIFFGANRVYLKRHIARSLETAAAFYHLTGAAG